MERGTPEGGMRFQEKQELSVERMEGLLNSMRNFDAVYARYAKTPEDFLGHMDEILAAGQDCPILEPRVFTHEIMQDEQNQRLFTHDFNSGKTKLFASLEWFQQYGVGKLPPDRERARVESIIDTWPIYRVVMEDLLVRNLHPAEVKESQRYPISVQEQQRNFDTLVHQLYDDNERAREICSVHAPDMFNPSESIEGNMGVILNAAMNIIRNACTEHVDAAAVDVQVMHEQDHLVYQVRDSGIGMPPSYLDSEHEHFIFAQGRSHRSSSGYGLMNMPGRLQSMGVELSVKSYQRKITAEGEYSHAQDVAFFSSNPNREAASLHLGKIEQSDDTHGTKHYQHAFTIFELRIPITQQT